MARSPTRDSVPAPAAGEERSTERKLAASPMISPPGDSTRDAAHEDFLFHLYRGSELLQENRVLEAKEELENALLLQPRDAKGQDLLAAVYFRIGLYPRAISIYLELEKQFPRDTSLKINLALLYLKTGQPEVARTSLYEVVRINPNHRRAWGYLGIAHEKLGDFNQAQMAFERGGHGQMAQRMAERLNRVTVPPPALLAEVAATGEVREVAGMAFEELDAGELNFALAEPGSGSRDFGTWHAVELGAARPPVVASIKSPHAETLSPPSIRLEDAMRSPASARIADHTATKLGTGTGDLPLTVTPPPAQQHASTPIPPHLPTPVVSVPPPEMGSALRNSALDFPSAGGVVMHASGLALAKTFEGKGLATRLEAMRLARGSFATQVMQRRSRDKETAEVFGGMGSPIVSAQGNAEFVLGPRPGHQLLALALVDELAFVREDVLLAFELCLGYENGRLAIDDGEPLAVVQLRGTGWMILDLLLGFVSADATPGRPVLVRKDCLVGWIRPPRPPPAPACRGPRRPARPRELQRRGHGFDGHALAAGAEERQDATAPRRHETISAGVVASWRRGDLSMGRCSMLRAVSDDAPPIPTASQPALPEARGERRRSLREDAVNIPNLLTMARIFAIPLFTCSSTCRRPRAASGPASSSRPPPSPTCSTAISRASSAS